MGLKCQQIIPSKHEPTNTETTSLAWNFRRQLSTAIRSARRLWNVWRKSSARGCAEARPGALASKRPIQRRVLPRIGVSGRCPIPPNITPKQSRPVPAAVVEPWVEPVTRLAGDEEFYRTESSRALEAGAIYRPENLAPRYVSYFHSVANSNKPPLR